MLCHFSAFGFQVVRGLLCIWLGAGVLGIAWSSKAFLAEAAARQLNS
jgi:hypothetical protein